MTDLYPEWRVGAISLTEAPYAVPFGGVDYGTPENVTQILQSLLQDGDIELSTRTGNRTLVLPVLIADSDMAALAEAEAALVAECDKPRNEVYVDPGDGFAAPFLFTVFRGQIAFNRDDNYEQHGFRSYVLTFRALPFPRSVDEVVTEALPASGTTTTLVNDGSATTNWTGAVNGMSTAPSVVSGAVKVASGSTSGAVTVRLTYTAAIATSATPWLVADWKPETPADGSALLAYGDGVSLRQDAQIGLPNGWYRTWFYVDAASVAVLRLESTTSGGTMLLGGSVPSVRSLSVDNIDRTDVKPSNGTTRQLQRSIEVAGSARTQGSLTVEHETDALGDVLVYVWPSGGADSPPMRQHRAPGGATVTSDSALVSGARDAIGSATTTWDIPAAALRGGLHKFLIRVSASLGALSTSMSLTWTVSTRVNGVTVGDTYTKSRVIAGTTGYEILTLDRLMVGTDDVDPNSTTAVVRITLTGSNADGGPPTINLDEGWLFHSEGQLVQVACGTGTAASGGPARRLFIEPATIARPRPTIRIGHAADGSDSYHPSGNAIGSWMMPKFTPPRVSVLTVTTNAEDAAVSLRGFPRWHTHAAS